MQGDKGQGGKGNGRGKDPLAAEGNLRKGEKPPATVKTKGAVRAPTRRIRCFRVRREGPYWIQREVTAGEGKAPKGSRQRSSCMTTIYGPKIRLESWPFDDDDDDDADEDDDDAA